MPAPDVPSVTVRPATPTDLTTMAAWQCRYVPDGLFPQMGERFVRRWHASFLDSPFGIALVAERVDAQGAQAVGFLVGSTDQFRHIDDVVRRHRVRLALAGLLALAQRPRLGAHFVRTRGRAYLKRILTPKSHRTPGPAAGTSSGAASGAASGAESSAARRATAGTESNATSGGQIAVVTAIAVDPAARGTGAGQKLLNRFLEDASAAGATRAELVTLLGEGNAAPFYERLNWSVVDEHPTRDGVNARTYRYELDDNGR
ncbi:GNAT family N-acetyltransferase [Arthrobacter sp. VKM Ac-2550]|uniref:GNAT family N-acetyltransferase n=1 Tax=Crystallibacter permensis TaxID=1938888 RepID=UPI0022267959|nr:GNAT family N-acetyltransferase [Arthrobacter sp. VKM Ac-2550]MCW2135278.1 Acetyltransferase (GNAT) domain-containing protein [Arthrobacter sp. VKM Ac-2550]